MKQCAGDLDRMEGLDAKLLRRELTAVAILPALCLQAFDVRPFRGESRGRHVHGARELRNAVAGQYGTSPFRIAKILELPRHRCNLSIEYDPSNLAGLAKNFRGLLGISLRFIAEPQAVAIDLNSTLHDGGPGDQDIVRRRDRAVALIGAEVRQFGAECFSPHESVAAVSRMAEIERVSHFGNEA